MKLTPNSKLPACPAGRQTPNSKGLIFVFSGPSGSGKTTLRDTLLKDAKFKGRIFKSVSFTTRPRRTRERSKRDYFFISEADFQRARKEKKILEWTRYLGYYYGTSQEFVRRALSQGRNLILCLDLKGARRVKRLYPENTVSVFVLAPSLKVLRSRIEKRCQKTPEKETCRRLELAAKEMKAASSFDYRVVNNNLKQAVADLKGVILKATGLT